MIEIKASGVDGLGDELRGTGERMDRALTAAAWEAELLLQREIKERTPIGATSVARESFIAEPPRRLADGVLGRVQSSAAHIVPLELGTKPHWAPLDPLIDWVKAKFGVTEDAVAEASAKRIQYAIAARGTLGVGMVHLTFRRFGDQVSRIFGKHIAGAVGGAAGA